MYISRTNQQLYSWMLDNVQQDLVDEAIGFDTQVVE